MPEPAAMKRSDWILLAFQQYIARHRIELDNDKTLQRVLVTISMNAKEGIPRGIRCNYESEEPFTISENSA
jgi:metal-responsive CopG/Arc/MetJ family transcriptional regulator